MPYPTTTISPGVLYSYYTPPHPSHLGYCCIHTIPHHTLLTWGTAVFLLYPTTPISPGLLLYSYYTPPHPSHLWYCCIHTIPHHTHLTWGTVFTQVPPFSHAQSTTRGQDMDLAPSASTTKVSMAGSLLVRDCVDVAMKVAEVGRLRVSSTCWRELNCSTRR